MTNVEHQIPPSSPTDNIKCLLAPALDIVLIAVLHVVERNEVINYSDIESCDSKKCLLRDSSNRDLDDNNKGLDQGVVMPIVAESHFSLVNGIVNAAPTLVLDSFLISLMEGAQTSNFFVHEFHNPSEKALPLGIIIPKRESSWWANPEMQKQKKVEERELTMLELQKFQEQAVCLAKENAAVERKLRKAHQSLFGMGPLAAPSTSTTFVESSVVVEFGRSDLELRTPMDASVSRAPLVVALFSISLCGCGSGFEGD